MNEIGGTVAGIFTASEAGTPMAEVSRSVLITSLGIESGGKVSCPITLITQEAIEKANASGADLTAAETQRNIVTEGIDPAELNELVGIDFYIAGVALRGVELCPPCKRPNKLAQKDGFFEAYKDMGGISAVVSNYGFIRPGDSIYVPVRKDVHETRTR